MSKMSDDLIAPLTASLAIVADRDRYRRERDELREALKHFADFPLEAFGWDDKRNDYPITGFNNWKLNVGHIRAIRTALAKVSP